MIEGIQREDAYPHKLRKVHMHIQIQKEGEVRVRGENNKRGRVREGK